MKNIDFKKIILLIVSCYIMGCQEQKNLSDVAQLPAKDKEAYLMTKTSLERLILMQEGLFTLYSPSREEALLLKSGDSLMVYSQQFGDKNKDGYWMYQKMYMSSFQEEPLSVGFLKFNKLTRDSFVVEQYVSKEDYKNADVNPQLLLRVDFNSLELSDCNIIFQKTGQLEFKGQTDTCIINYEGGAMQITSNVYHIYLDGFNVKTNHYKKEEGKVVYDSFGDAYFNYNYRKEK